MTQGEAYEWLRDHAIGPLPDGQARLLATRLSADLARLVHRHVTPDPWGWRERIESYEFETGFPGSLFVAADGRLVGTWIMGNDYRVKSGYHGGYPNTYLPRVRALFRDKTRVLHLFSGQVETTLYPGHTVDLDDALLPDYHDDAQKLERVPLDQYDIVLADPPYTDEDAARYGTTLVKRNLVLRALSRLSPGAYVVWLDMVLPMWRKDDFDLIGVVGLVRSTNHRFRLMSVFRRK